jgi:hypothetical protein
VSEKAVGYFERAALMQPQEPKWQLMVASCYRRSGNYHRALETYKMIHRRFPANIECLKFLVSNPSIIKQVASNKSSLLLNNILQNTQKL